MFQSVVARKRLGEGLKAARMAAGMNTTQAAQVIGRNQSTMSRIELAKTSITMQDLAKLARAYGVGEHEHARLRTLLQEVRDGDRWWDAYGPWLTPEYAELISVENEADLLTTIQLSVIPGLLQTPAYFQAMSARNPLLTDLDRVAALGKVRANRQRRLADANPLQMIAYSSEAVLHHQYGSDEVHREQLVHLRQMCDHRQVTFRLLPFRAMIDVPNIGLYEFGDDVAPIAICSDLLNEVSTDRDLNIRRICRTIEWVDKAALSPEESAKMIEHRLETA